MTFTLEPTSFMFFYLTVAIALLALSLAVYATSKGRPTDRR